MTYQQFLVRLSKPAGRALSLYGIDSFEQLAALTEKEVLAFHGVGPASLPTMREGLIQVGLTFKETVERELVEKVSRSD